ncbi:MAG: hypothetical protein ACI4V1_05335 [Eubacteriales bacterium]
MKRFLALLLALLMAAGTVACSETGSEETAPESSAEVGAAETPAAEEEETLPKPDLPAKDFDGYNYRILSTDSTTQFIYAAESTGETVNDAVFDANSEVAEQFNITYSTVSITSNSDAAIIQAYIMAGDDAYDIAQLHDCTSGSMALNGWFHNIYEIPYIDTTAVWWPQFTVDSLTLNGKMYYISNYTTYRALHETRVTFFNKDLIADLGLTEPYELVKDGTWTIDTMASMADIYIDANGDNKQDKADIMGFVFTSAPYCWLEGFGIESYQKTGNGSEMVLNVNNERTISLVDKLYSWLCSGSNSVWCKMGNAREEAMEMFAAGTAVFTFKCIGDQIPYLMETDINYGIAPFPKLDETQSDYIGPCTDLLLSIPITAGDLERTGIIAEAMSYAGYKNILPAYSEKALKNRYSTDLESAEMLDIVFANRIISFSYLFVNMGPGMQLRLISSTIGSDNNNISSYYQTNEKAESKVMEKVADFYQ